MENYSLGFNRAAVSSPKAVNARRGRESAMICCHLVSPFNSGKMAGKSSARRSRSAGERARIAASISATVFIEREITPAVARGKMIFSCRRRREESHSNGEEDNESRHLDSYIKLAARRGRRRRHSATPAHSRSDNAGRLPACWSAAPSQAMVWPRSSMLREASSSLDTSPFSRP